jgi:hypothetical protein
MSPNAVAKELRIPSGSVTAWKSGAEPRNKTIVKIAEYFSVPVSHFTDPADKKEKPTETNLDGLLPGFDELSEENKVKAREYIELLLKTQQI